MHLPGHEITVQGKASGASEDTPFQDQQPPGRLGTRLPGGKSLTYSKATWGNAGTQHGKEQNTSFHLGTDRERAYEPHRGHLPSSPATHSVHGGWARLNCQYGQESTGAAR